MQRRHEANPLRFLLAFLIVCGLGIAASASGATVRGQITHRGGRAAQFVPVRVVSPSGAASSIAQTGDDGWFYLPNVPPGKYTLEVRATDLVKLELEVREPVTDVGVVTIP